MPMSHPPMPSLMNCEQKRASGDATAQVAGQGQREPAAVGDAVHRGDHWLLEAAQFLR